VCSLVGSDTPEIDEHARCENEYDPGTRASELLKALHGQQLSE
jgi:hypothetical protein